MYDPHFEILLAEERDVGEVMVMVGCDTAPRFVARIKGTLVLDEERLFSIETEVEEVQWTDEVDDENGIAVQDACKFVGCALLHTISEMLGVEVPPEGIEVLGEAESLIH